MAEYLVNMVNLLYEMVGENYLSVGIFSSLDAVAPYWTLAKRRSSS
jgi:hypothetical protein